MRAAAADFRTARLLGVSANGVISFAVLLSGVLAAVVAVILTVAEPATSPPTTALQDTIVVLVGVVVGGLDRLWSATLGGFAIGFATGALGGFLPSTGEWPFTSSVYLDSAVFALVVLVLLLRPGGLFVARGQRAWSAYESHALGSWKRGRRSADEARERRLAAPGAREPDRRSSGSWAAPCRHARSIEFTDALVSAATVVALYVFVGNSGVLSFGQISFFIVGAYAAGELTVPADAKHGVLPNVFSIIQDHTIGNAWSLVLARPVSAPSTHSSSACR